MRANSAIPPGISRSLPLVLALVALFFWTSVAQAQSLEAASYDNPAESVAAADTSAGGGGDAGSGVQGVSLLPADSATPASGSGSAGSGTLGIGLLPSTGGPLLPLMGLGVVMLGATGLLASLRHSRR